MNLIKSKWRNYVYLQLQKFTNKKLGGSESRFLPQNCAKNYLHAFAISKIFAGIIRRTSVEMGEGGIGLEVGDEEEMGKKGKGRGGEGRGGEAVVACLTNFCSVEPPLQMLRPYTSCTSWC
jgi:hypothetical protein